jgi:deazaflavin-dependent oxidoreductase (nitroreductase family)
LRRVLRLLLWLVAIQVFVVSVFAAAALIVKRRFVSAGDEESDELTWVTIFDGGERKSRAKAFRRGTWLASFGGGDLDLREATLDPAGAHITLWAMMGGGDLLVPPDWRVDLRSRSVMGGAESYVQSAGDSPSGPVLVVEANLLMGGFSIKAPEAEPAEPAEPAQETDDTARDEGAGAMDQRIREAIESGRVIDITTTGRQTGESRRIEIWFHNVDGDVYITGTPGRRSWYANLLASPDFTFHLKETVQADLAARARPILDDGERREVLATVVDGLDGERDLDAWVRGSPLVQVEFPD